MYVYPCKCMCSLCEKDRARNSRGLWPHGERKRVCQKHIFFRNIEHMSKSLMLKSERMKTRRLCPFFRDLRNSIFFTQYLVLCSYREQFSVLNAWLRNSILLLKITLAHVDFFYQFHINFLLIKTLNKLRKLLNFTVFIYFFLFILKRSIRIFANI